MCETVRFPDGTTAIVCGVRRPRPKRCVHCGGASSQLCDGPPRYHDGRKTCDRPICRQCAIHVPPNLDFCRDHRAAAAAAAEQLALFPGERGQ